MDAFFEKARHGKATTGYITREEVARDKEKEQLTHTQVVSQRKTFIGKA